MIHKSDDLPLVQPFLHRDYFAAALTLVEMDMQPLMEAGLDSLGAVELRSSLENAFALEMPATVTFDYPSVAALAKYISSQLPLADQVRTTNTHRVTFSPSKAPAIMRTSFALMQIFLQSPDGVSPIG